MASGYYNSFYTSLLKAVFDFSVAGAQTYKVALLTSAYIFDETAKDTHDFLDDVNGNEVSGTGYTAGGATIANMDVTQNDTLNKTVVDGDDAQWASSTITARGAVIYKSTGTASTSPLVRYIDFGTDQSSANTLFKIEWSSAGIADLTQA